MKLGLLLTAAHDATTPPSVQLEEHVRLVRMADELGFDVVIAGQHFLSPSLRYYQPIPYLAHMAAVAPRLRYATGILLLPLLHPVQVAEEMATLDVVTGGSSVMGAGIGYADLEFRTFGVDRRTRTDRFEESLEVIRSIWSGDDIHHVGRHWSLDLPSTSVVPVQPGGPPVWIAGQTEPAVRRAARLGDAWYVPPFPSHHGLIRLRESYDDERGRYGLGPPTEWPVRRELFVAPSVDAALARIGSSVEQRFGTYVQWGMRTDGDVSSDFAASAESAFDSRFIVGPPARCAEALCGLAELGATTFVAKVQWPGLDVSESYRQLELLATEVMPLVDPAWP